MHQVGVNYPFKKTFQVWLIKTYMVIVLSLLNVGMKGVTLWRQQELLSQISLIHHR